MEMVKTGLIFAYIFYLFFATLILFSFIFAKIPPLFGKIIVLDAGHGNENLGATYPPNSQDKSQVKEKDLNLAVAYLLKEKLEKAGAEVLLTRKCDEKISFREDILERCEDYFGRKCDLLVSIHHNGSLDPNFNGTTVLYEKEEDLALANSLKKSLLEKFNLPDLGLTLKKNKIPGNPHLISVLTEAYYITNRKEANDYLSGKPVLICDQNGDSLLDYPVLIGEKIEKEAQALFEGIINCTTLANCF